MNQGIKKEHGKYIIFLHGDDYFINNKSTDNMHTAIKEAGNSELIIGNHTFLYKGNVFTRKARQLYLKVLPYMNFIPHPNTLVKKTLFTQIGYFRTDLKINMDYEFHLQILKSKAKISITNTSFTMFRKHNKGLSNSPENRLFMIKEALMVQKGYRATPNITK